MRPTEDIKKLIKNLNDKTSAEMDRRVVKDVLLALEQSRKTTTPLGRTIMKNPITKLAAAAVIILALILSISFWDKSTSTAYAFEQTVKANHTVRYLNMSYIDAGYENEPKEFWIECDESGRITNARWHMPAWDSPDDGAKVGVWSDNIAQIWFQRKNSLVIFRNKTVAADFLKLVEKYDPRLIVQRLYEQEQQGQVNLTIDEPSDESQPIVVTATYSHESSNSGWRDILYVDQATKLVKSIEFYKQIDDRYEYKGVQEFRDYNVAIDPEMFSLEDEVPADVMRVDQVSQEVGLAQGDLSDEEIAVEVVRQFFEAMINKDYEKAGILFGGIPADKMQQMFGRLNVVRIVSIDEPKPNPTPGVGGFVVPCEVEIEDQNGNKSIWKPYGPAVRPVGPEISPDRWNLHGGI